MKFKLVIATNNKNKLNEIKKLLNFKNVEVLSLNNFGNISIKETKKTFFENAYLKAKKIYLLTKLPTIADDSGLEVEILGGAPGVYSKRYAGKNANDKDRIRKLLEELKNVPFEKRKARFVCCAVFIDKNIEKTVYGFCDGFIAEKPSGKYGFGYDPVFFIPDLRKTMAQLPLKFKNVISHRANAFKKLREFLINEYGFS